jgi:hypothetical protein
VTSGLDHACSTTTKGGLPDGPASGSAEMTPETARWLAATLAPHLVAMRVVTAGTRYEACEVASGTPGTGRPPGPRISPATKIFIAGMLELIDGERAADPVSTAQPAG